MHEEMYGLFDKICDELCEYGQKELNMESLKVIDTLAHAGKNILKVMEGMDEGSSGRGSSYGYYDEDPETAAMGSMRGSSRRGGSSRMSGKRDSMGRYSREGSSYEGGGSNRGGSSRGGSSRDGYSRGNNVTDGLRELMYAAPPEMQGEIQRLIKKLDNM